MMSSAATLPARLAEIVEDFKLSEGREKLELLLQYSESLPPLPDWLKGKEDCMEEVPECMTPVSVTAEMKDGKLTFYFAAPVESPTVRGYAAILAEVAREAMETARRHGVVVSYDLNYRPSLWKSIGGHQKAREVNREIARHVDALGWENTTIERFFDTAVRYARDSVNGNPNYSRPDNPWRRLSKIQSDCPGNAECGGNQNR